MKNISSSNLKNLSLKELNNRASLLKEMCLKIDPYSPLQPREKEELQELGIKNIDDPFRLTNELILRMEDTLEEIDQRTKDLPNQLLQ